MSETTVQRLFSFIEQSPTAFHAIEYMRKKLLDEIYTAAGGNRLAADTGERVFCDPQWFGNPGIQDTGRCTGGLSDHGQPQRFSAV